MRVWYDRVLVEIVDRTYGDEGCPISSQSMSVLRRDSFSAAIQRAGFENIILFITLASPILTLDLFLQ